MADLLTPQDVIDDFLAVVDNKTWVVYGVTNDDGVVSSTIPVGDEDDPRCLRFGSSTDQWIDGNLISSSDVVVWHILRIDLPDIVPKVGDRITDKDEQVWEVKSHKLLSWETRYRFVCLRL